MKTLKVTVTKRDIQKGKKHSPIMCPIALAIRASNLFTNSIKVRSDCIEMFDGKGTEIDLPMKATNFIERFDSGESVKPFSFTLKVP